jgi:hypothetical protein
MTLEKQYEAHVRTKKAEGAGYLSFTSFKEMVRVNKSIKAKSKTIVKKIVGKYCNKCGYKKEFSEFAKNSRSTDGFDGYCLLCKKKKNREYYLKKQK